MKVYVLTREERNEGGRVEGLFQTVEAATDIALLIAKNGPDDCWPVNDIVQWSAQHRTLCKQWTWQLNTVDFLRIQERELEIDFTDAETSPLKDLKFHAPNLASGEQAHELRIDYCDENNVYFDFANEIELEYDLNKEPPSFQDTCKTQSLFHQIAKAKSYEEREELLKELQQLTTDPTSDSISRECEAIMAKFDDAIEQLKAIKHLL